MSPILYFVPSLFTMLNLGFGTVSIALSVNGNTVLAAWFVIFAILCDGMDGKIARLTHTTSSFGNELDSLADIVSSGVAPGTLIFRLLSGSNFFAAVVFLLFYVSAGTYRLARFNVLQKGDRTKGYLGLPIPVAGFTIASFCLFLDQNSVYFITQNWLYCIVPVVSLLMVSTVPYAWPRLEFSKGKTRIFISIAKLAVLAAMTLFPYQVLFPVFCGYIIYGVTCRLIKPETAAYGFFLIRHNTKQVK